jgi:hypothetical protein
MAKNAENAAFFVKFIEREVHFESSSGRLKDRRIYIVFVEIRVR